MLLVWNRGFPYELHWDMPMAISTAIQTKVVTVFTSDCNDHITDIHYDSLNNNDLERENMSCMVPGLAYYKN